MQSFLGSRALPELVYHQPKELDGALKLMRQKEPWTLIAGGTDLIPGLRKGVRSYPDGVHFIDIRNVQDLQGITLDNDMITVKAATRLADIISSPIMSTHAPLLAAAVQDMASLQVRNSATIGGNLCTASPAADTAPPLLALQARVVIADVDGSMQTVPLDTFFTGPGQCMCQTGKLLTAIQFPAQGPHEYTYRRKMGLRKAFTISVISMALRARIQEGVCEDVCLAYGAVGPTPLRAYGAEDLLRGQRLSAEGIDRAAEQAGKEVSPISDVRASAEYRRDMAHVLAKRALHSVLAASQET